MVIRWLTCIVIPISILVGWLIINPLFADISLRSFLKEGLEKAIHYTPGNAWYHYLLGRFFESDLKESDLKKAVESYREALRLNPLDSRVWIALARAYEGLGMEKEADLSLSKAILVNPNNSDLRWEAGVFYLLREKTDKSFLNLREYLILKPENQNMVYDLSERLTIENRYILTNLIPPSYNYYKGYLSYLISNNKLVNAREVWNVISEGQKIEKGLYLKYIDFLISNSEYSEARQLWMSALKDFGRIGNPDIENAGSEDILWNGGFEKVPIDGGFDWKIGKEEGVKISIDNDVHREGLKSLSMVFNGKHNPDLVAASQVTLLKPDTTYTLKGYIKTEDLTTTNGIFIDITGHNQSKGSCGKGLYKTTDTVTGTNHWKEVQIDFMTPPDCYAGIISIKRQRSTKFDNKIGGSAWIDKITIKEGERSYSR
ncbi:MAG: tetratricopeptide repeat protein [Nitrospirae bacterium]|nr:tetratricopeptide repeat protein [Nitrospirota bacterium]